MNITKEETIIALLDSEKVASVEIEAYGIEDVFIVSNLDEFDEIWMTEATAIKSFTPKYVDPAFFDEGDIVWCYDGGITKLIVADNQIGHYVVQFENGNTWTVSYGSLILIKKANDKGVSDE